MPIETWGEFENAMAATIKNYAINLLENVDPGKENHSAINSYVEGMLMGISQSMQTYYDKMKKNTLGVPNEENIDAMLDLFWNELKESEGFKSVIDEDMWGDGIALKIDKESFKKDFMKNITLYQTEMYKRNLTMQDIACFRFAADGRTNETGYKNFNQASLENLGTLANLCCSLDGVKGKNGEKLYTKASMETLRPAIIQELQNHANRQVKQEMNSDEVQVFLCGGFGEPGDKGDKGVGQVMPEHMWLELRYKDGTTTSIDTFPNASIRIAPEFEGAPSEPKRVHEEGKTVKVPLKGIPEGIVKALASGKTVALDIQDGEYAKHKKDLTIYITPDGEIMKGKAAKQEFDKVYSSGVVEEPPALSI